MSQVTIRPSGGRAAAIDRAEYPVNVPISSTRRAPVMNTRNSRKRPSRTPTIIPWASDTSLVSAASAVSHGASGLEWATQ